jgi:tRNA A22 N-methylase
MLVHQHHLPRLTYFKNLLSLETEEVWDIGCDHGQFGLACAEENSGTLKKICFIDPSLEVIRPLQKKLEIWKKHASSRNPQDTQIEFEVRHCLAQDLSVPAQGHRLSLCLFGFGGREMKIILQCWEKVLSERKIFWECLVSPHRGEWELRRFLLSTPWHLQAEGVVNEESQFYHWIHFSNQASPKKFTLWGGEELWGSSGGENWKGVLLKNCRHVQKGDLSELVKYLQGRKYLNQ